VTADRLGSWEVSMLADDAALCACTLRRAMPRPDRYVAAALAERTDEGLGADLGCAPSVRWRLGLMV
jgi:hypothetical protein